MKDSKPIVLLAGIIIGFCISLGVVDYVYEEPKVELRIAHPDDVQSKIVRVNNQIDYRFLFFPWGPYTEWELASKHKISYPEARKIIKELTCGKEGR